MKKRFITVLPALCIVMGIMLSSVFAAGAVQIKRDNDETADRPVIESQNPKNSEITAYVNSGEIVLSVTAKGNGDLSYEWYVDGSPQYCGKDVFVFDPVQHTPKNDGSPYSVYCTVTNTLGDTLEETASKAWSIYVKHPVGPEITNSASASEITGNGTAKFTVEAKGENLIYQWYLMDDAGGKRAVSDGVSGSFEYSGASTKTLSVKCTDVMNSVAHSYVCEVTSQSGITSTTDVYILYANPDPALDTVQSIEVGRLPGRTSYKVGDKLDISGMTLNVTTGRGTESITSGFVCTPTYLNEAGNTVVTVSYGGKTTTFTVSVEKGEHEHKWSQWEKNDAGKTVQRRCTVENCDVSERYTFSEFLRQFPDEAKALGIETDENGSPSGSGDKPNSGGSDNDGDKNTDKDVSGSDKEDSGVKKNGGVSSPFLWIIIVIAFLILAGAGCYYFLVYRKPGDAAKSKKPGPGTPKKVSVHKKDGGSGKRR